ncbi:hypothetical protein [Mycoplasmopsis alligatoris]|uniref:Lipoprotein n=1 Tax=Mycoplasmopsis alligatoris A21JP2 TaxID=747682 RepID=D4XW45_9BACT|nr:hypothetical protein [Mycoplasmopsis alligatoris]EFF41434.1 hypothetical protein MALL_0732 [Mycoplasmopsis alligatoris A21JP2]
MKKIKALKIATLALLATPLIVASCQSNNQVTIKNESDRLSHEKILEINNTIKNIKNDLFDIHLWNEGKNSFLKDIFAKVTGSDLNKKQIVPNSLLRTYQLLKSSVDQQEWNDSLGELEQNFEEKLVFQLNHALGVIKEAIDESSEWSENLKGLNELNSNLEKGILNENKKWQDEIKKVKNFTIGHIFNKVYFEGTQKNRLNASNEIPDVGHGKDEHAHVLGNIIIDINILIKNILFTLDIAKYEKIIETKNFKNKEEVKKNLIQFKNEIAEFKKWFDATSKEFFNSVAQEFSKRYELVIKQIQDLASIRKVSLD